MNFEIISHQDLSLAVLSSDSPAIQTAQKALEIMMNAAYQGAEVLVVTEEQLHPSFFDLKTGLAGDILQKFSNYQTRLVIIGQFTSFQSKSLDDFIRESNKTGRILFVNTLSQALDVLSSR